MNWRALAPWTGLVIMMIAALLANIAVKEMSQVVNSQRTQHGKVHWEFNGDEANREVIRVYRENNPGGPLFRTFLFACGLFIVGGVVMFLKDLP